MSTFHPTGTTLVLLASTLFAQPGDLSNSLAAEVRRQSPPLSHPKLDAYCQALGQRLLPGSTIHFEVIRSESAEPVPLRGGPIFVPTRLLLTARSNAEVAAVLAHALAHSTEPISSRRVVFPLHDEAQYAIPLGHQVARQASELAADRQALEFSQRGGFPPGALAEYLRRVLPPNNPRLANLPPPDDDAAAPDEWFLEIQTLVKSLLPVRRPPTLHREPSAELK